MALQFWLGKTLASHQVNLPSRGVRNECVQWLWGDFRQGFRKFSFMFSCNSTSFETAVSNYSDCLQKPTQRWTSAESVLLFHSRKKWLVLESEQIKYMNTKRHAITHRLIHMLNEWELYAIGLYELGHKAGQDSFIWTHFILKTTQCA